MSKAIASFVVGCWCLILGAYGLLRCFWNGHEQDPRAPRLTMWSGSERYSMISCRVCGFVYWAEANPDEPAIGGVTSSSDGVVLGGQVLR